VLFKPIILAAGLGSRMKSETPKPLHKICGKEMINMILDSCQNAGLSPAIIVIPENSDQFESVTRKKTQYVIQKQPKGSGDALSQIKQLSEYENIIVLNSDIPLITPSTISKLIESHIESNATITLLTSIPTENKGLGRILRDDKNNILSIIEEVDVDSQTRNIEEINVGAYCFQSSWVSQALKELHPANNGELYLTDLIHIASSQSQHIESVKLNDSNEGLGVNDRAQLVKLESILRTQINNKLLLNGITIIDPKTTYIDQDVQISKDTTINPNTHIKDGSIIGSNCVIGPDCTIQGSYIGNDCVTVSSTIEYSKIYDNVHIGPYAHIRKDSILEKNVHIGNYCEIKNSHIGQNSKSGHFSYLGDARIGKNVNIGAGTITCNYDGSKKNKTIIEDNAFIGSNTMLVAPVTIGSNSITGVSSVITKNVPKNSKAIGSPARIFKTDQRKHR